MRNQATLALIGAILALGGLFQLATGRRLGLGVSRATPAAHRIAGAVILVAGVGVLAYWLLTRHA